MDCEGAAGGAEDEEPACQREPASQIVRRLRARGAPIADTQRLMLQGLKADLVARLEEAVAAEQPAAPAKPHGGRSAPAAAADEPQPMAVDKPQKAAPAAASSAPAAQAATGYAAPGAAAAAARAAADAEQPADDAAPGSDDMEQEVSGGAAAAAAGTFMASCSCLRLSYGQPHPAAGQPRHTGSHTRLHCCTPASMAAGRRGGRRGRAGRGGGGRSGHRGSWLRGWG